LSNKFTFSYAFVLWVSTIVLSHIGLSQEIPSSDSRIYYVGGDHKFPPYEYLNEKNEPEGYVVDVMRAVAKAAHIRIDIQLQSWSNARFALENRKIDILEGMFYSRERDKVFDYSDPHTTVSHTIFVRTDNTAIQSPKDLVGKSVIVQKDDIMHDYLLNRKFDCKIVTVENPEQALDLLASGKHDCALIAEMQGLYYLNLKKITNLTVAGASFYNVRYCFAVAEGDSILLKRLDGGLKIIKSTGEYYMIYDHWFGKADISKLKMTLFYILIAAFVLMSATLFGTHVWTSTLRTKVKKATEDLTKEIVERKKIEGKLAEEKILLRLVIDNIPDEIFVKDIHSRFILVNQAVLKGHGFSTSEEIVGKTDFDLFPPERAKIFWDEEQTIFRTQKPMLNVESSYIGKDNKLGWTATSKILMKNIHGAVIGLVGVKRFITDQKLAEEEALRARKIESLGILAGGIAHDFNNILTIILGNISLSKSLINPDSKIVKYLTNSEIASLRARDLIQKLLTFSKGGQPIRKPIAIGNLLQETVTLSLSGSKARSVFSIPHDLWTVEVDESQMNQVISNLVINADQAMPTGGIIEIFAENTILEETKYALPAGKYIRIIFKDSGIGIQREYLQKIFDPYFTTKSKGSGLGLATTYSIIKNHNGAITVDSEVGKGAVFTILLPASEKEATTKETSSATDFRGTGNILVMDDEDYVRDLLGSILSGLGFHVDFAENGDQAIQKYQDAMHSGQPFHAVILDLTIPGGMGGKETIGHLLKIDPNIKAIVSSGYSNDPLMAHYKDYGFCGVVAKPYDINQLINVMKSIEG